MQLLGTQFRLVGLIVKDTGRCSRAWRRTRLLRERRMAAELDLDDVAAAELAELRRRLESRGE